MQIFEFIKSNFKYLIKISFSTFTRQYRIIYSYSSFNLVVTFWFILKIFISWNDYNKAQIRSKINQLKPKKIQLPITTYSVKQKQSTVRYNQDFKLSYSSKKTEFTITCTLISIQNVIHFFRYKFSVRNPYERSPSWSTDKSGDEFDFLFGRPIATLKNQGSLSTAKEVALSKFVIQSWSTFVKTG